MTLPDNVHRLTRPHLTMRPGAGLHRLDPLLDQLAEAVKPGMRVGGSGQSGDYLPINAAAVDLWKQLDAQARVEEQARRGRARGTLGTIVAGWGTETNTTWEARLQGVTQHFIDHIVNLLDPPPKRRPLGHPCYACGEEWVHNTEGDRTPAVTLGTHHDTGELRDLPDMDMTCEACQATWNGNEMRWPLAVVTEQGQNVIH